MSNATISIVTPSYNQGAFLEETIRSVISQEGDFSLDYIIVDGGSTDNSLEIIRKYEALFKEGKWPIQCQGIRYRWLSGPDSGQADAINKGFRLADGDILAWLNSDDTYLEGTLLKVADFFAMHPETDVLYGRSRFVNEIGKAMGDYPTRPFDPRLLATFNFVCQPSAFFRRAALEWTGPLDSGLRYVMDYELWIRMSKRYSFVYLPEFLSTYRLHEMSKTISARDAVANHEECLRTVLKYYDWAPFNRVYGYCHHVIRSRLPLSLGKVRVVAIPLSLIFSLLKYLKLNKKVKIEDLKMINSVNAGKLFKDWIDIFREY